MSKAVEPFKFILHKEYRDLSDKIRQKLSTYTSQWFEDTTRQTVSSVHKHTNSVFVYEYDAKWTKNTKYNLDVRCKDQELLDLVAPIIKDLEGLHNGRVGKALFIKLPPSKDVNPHIDFGDYLESVRRHHIAILTNPKVSFIIDGEKQFMDIGECWEVNNNKMHQVWNEGDTDRIHLLIDIIPNSLIGE